MRNFFKIFGIGFFVFALLFGVNLGSASIANAQTATSTPGNLQNQINAQNQQIGIINQQIAQYQIELNKIGSDKKTLQDAINALNIQRSKVQAQISLTQHQIDNTKLQIVQLGVGIATTQDTISKNQIALGASLKGLEIIDEQPFILQVLGSNVMDVWTDVDATSQIMNAIRNNMHTLQAQKASLANSQVASKQKQNSLTSQKTLLTTQQQDLNQTKQLKNQLLAQTKAQESIYQNLIAQAKAELNSFSTFTQSAGGSKLLYNQTSCDAWGCYYNQRDSVWGNLALNGTQYRLASDGCLVAAMAMVMTHYGYKDVTPITINSNPNNFATYYPAYLLQTIYVDGLTVTRVTTKIDATLKTGHPVVVGLHAYGGTHFVVLTGGSRGVYTMRDPYVENGKDISFTSHYTVRNIYAITKVVIS